MPLPIPTSSTFPHEIDLNRQVRSIAPASNENQYQGPMPGVGEWKLIFNENPGRVALFIQNHGLVKLYFAFRASCNDQLGGFHHILVPCSIAYDGYGGTVINSSWRGPCAVYAQSPAALFTAWEMYI